MAATISAMPRRHERFAARAWRASESKPRGSPAEPVRRNVAKRLALRRTGQIDAAYVPAVVGIGLRESVHGHRIRKPTGQFQRLRLLLERFILIQEAATAMSGIDSRLAQFGRRSALVSPKAQCPTILPSAATATTEITTPWAFCATIRSENKRLR